MLPREISDKLLLSFRHFPVLLLTGPRQSGKTTLVKKLFADKPYVNLEFFRDREFAMTDPIGFLRQFPEGAVFDEVQKAPELFSDLQVMADQMGGVGRFVLTGSENLLLSDTVSQSLAGRVSINVLYPFSFKELEGRLDRTLNKSLLEGFYPRIVAEGAPYNQAIPDYIATYVERDVRQVANIGNLSQFQRFLNIAASQVGQLLNRESLSNAVGVSAPTIQRWLSILEATFVTFRLTPWYRNIKKRLVKMPKLYFYDTGILCSLLGIRTQADLVGHPLYGQIFENLQIVEVLKTLEVASQKRNVFFFRDHNGREIDLLIQYGSSFLGIEIKSALSFHKRFFDGFKAFSNIDKNLLIDQIVILGGEDRQERTDGTILPWNQIGQEIRKREQGS